MKMALCSYFSKIHFFVNYCTAKNDTLFKFILKSLIALLNEIVGMKRFNVVKSRIYRPIKPHTNEFVELGNRKNGTQDYITSF